MFSYILTNTQINFINWILNNKDKKVVQLKYRT